MWSVVGLIVCGGGVLWCVVCELPTAFLADQARCTVGIDWDPLVRCSHPGRLMRTPKSQLLRAWLVLACKTAHVDTSVGRSENATSVARSLGREEGGRRGRRANERASERADWPFVCLEGGWRGPASERTGRSFAGVRGEGKASERARECAIERASFFFVSLRHVYFRFSFFSSFFHFFGAGVYFSIFLPDGPSGGTLFLFCFFQFPRSFVELRLSSLKMSSQHTFGLSLDTQICVL